MTSDDDGTAKGEALVPDQVTGGPPAIGDIGGLGDLFGGALPDLGGLMAGMAQVQAAQAENYQGQAGGGAVKVVASGAGRFLSVTIDPDVVNPDDVEMLQDLVLAALNDVSTRITQAQEKAMGGLSFGGLLSPDQE
jgi:DNA-binding YbaB/EbfC family protein